MNLTGLAVVPNPQCYPLPLAKYGLNPYQEPVYRVVYAPSVKKIVGGKFSDGYTGYRARAAYKHLGQVWALEKWISAFDFTHMNEQQYTDAYRDYETGLFPAGPYPSRGVYHLCEALSCSPEDANFEKLIQWIERGKYNSVARNRDALMKAMDDKEAAEQKQRFDRCKEILPAFGVRAASYGDHPKKMKSAPMMKDARELGLPIKTGPRVMKETCEYR